MAQLVKPDFWVLSLSPILGLDSWVLSLNPILVSMLGVEPTKKKKKKKLFIVLIPKACEYITLYDKEELKLQMELGLLNS